MTVWEDRFEPWTPKPTDSRTPFEVDYARVVHSASFRRLQGKTQILSLGDSDFYRTRLTHSMEVSQISGGILQHLRRQEPIPALLPSQSLMQAICLAHDLGHPPFGHGGEVALNYCMRTNGGFEGNGQSLRILTRLEKFSSRAGSNFTRRTLMGILKYPIPYSRAKATGWRPSLAESKTGTTLINREETKPPKCYLDSEDEIVEWLLSSLTDHDRNFFLMTKSIGDGGPTKTMHKSLDCSVMELGDDISYGVHDLEDAIALRLVSAEQFREDVPKELLSPLLRDLVSGYSGETVKEDDYETLIAMLFGSSGGNRKRQISRLVHSFITKAEITDLSDDLAEPLVRYNATLPADVRTSLKALQAFIVKRVIKSPSVQHLEFKGQQMIVNVFEALAHDPDHFLPKDTLSLFNDATCGVRVICDHIAGMTDHFLIRTYERLFQPRIGSVFDRL